MMNKVINMISLAQKAGKIKSGEENVLNIIKQKKAEIVFLAEDISDNTAKRICDKANYRDIPVYRIFDRDTLGRAIGKKERAVVAITDKNFAGGIIKILRGEEYGENKSL